MYIWFMLGHGAATADTICIYLRASPQDLVLLGMLGAIFSFMLLRIRHVYGCGNSGLFTLLLQAQQVSLQTQYVAIL